MSELPESASSTVDASSVVMDDLSVIEVSNGLVYSVRSDISQWPQFQEDGRRLTSFVSDFFFVY